jgi:hypothetical protein
MKSLAQIKNIQDKLKEEYFAKKQLLPTLNSSDKIRLTSELLDMQIGITTLDLFFE